MLVESERTLPRDHYERGKSYMSRFGNVPGDPGKFDEGSRTSQPDRADASRYFQDFKEAVAASKGLSLRYRDPTEIKPAELQGFKAGLVIASAYDPKVALSDNGQYLAVVVEESLGFVALPTKEGAKPKMFTHLMSEIHQGSGGASEITFAKTWNGVVLTTCADGASTYRLAYSEDRNQPPRLVGGTPAGYLSGLQALSPAGQHIAHCYFNGGESTSVTICPLHVVDYVYAPESFRMRGSTQAMRFNADGSLLAAGSDSGHLHVHSANLLSREAPISTRLKEPISSVGFGGDTVFAGTDGGRLIALTRGEQPESPVIRFDKPLTKGTITAITPCGQDNSVLVGTSKGEVFRVNQDGDAQLLGTCPEEKINSITTSADGSTIAIGLFKGGALVFHKQ